MGKETLYAGVDDNGVLYYIEYIKGKPIQRKIRFQYKTGDYLTKDDIIKLGKELQNLHNTIKIE